MKDYKLTAEDYKHYKANQARSYAEHMRLSKVGEGARLILNGVRVK